ncbi:PaaI family thioesterase [Gordonia sp. DT30]|uniref:PaaI family thioesterase n=1 Tax=Gordonia sp. DT30 TaxID=3416546 RepID=UPI003CF93077
MNTAPRPDRPGFAVPDDLDPLTRHPKAVAPGAQIRMHNPMCLGCGEDAPRGLHLVVRAGEGFTVETEMDVEPWMEGGPGVIHGGVLSTAFDEVMGTAPLLVGPSAVTVHLEVDFLAPVPVGSRLQLTARLLGRQRRKIYVEATAHIGDPDSPVAVGHSIFVTINPREHFAEHVDNSQMAEEYKQRLARP